MKTTLLKLILHGIQPETETKKSWLPRFLVFVVLSTVFWFLVALNKDYTSYVNIPVRYTHFGDNKLLVNELPQRFSVQLRTSGFSLMFYHLGLIDTDLVIDYPADIGTRMSKGQKETTITSAILIDIFSKQMPPDVQVTDVKPRLLTVYFSEKAEKRVPLINDVTYTLARQFTIKDSLRISPMFVTITGPASLLNEINSVKTEHIELKNLSGPINRKVKLLPLENEVQLLPAEVSMTIDVEKYTEGVVELLVEPIGLNPLYTIRIVPEKVKVKYLVGLSRYESIVNSMFKVVVDLSSQEEKPVNKLKVDVVSHPSFVEVVEIQPAKVDYILRK